MTNVKILHLLRRYHLSIIFVSLLLINLFLRFFFIFYGYIQTEEGTIIHNEYLSYRGYLPFIHYDAWNSLLNDYLIGWIHFFVTPTIIIQRFIGLTISLAVMFLSIKSSEVFHHKLAGVYTLLFLTLGSFLYIYLSNIPYSEQTMTLFLCLSIYSITTLQPNHNSYRHIFFVLVFSLLAGIIRIQAIPAMIFIWVYIFWEYKKEVKKVYISSSIAIIIGIIVLFPFLMRSNYLLYAFTWPFMANKVLIYQQGITYSFTSLFVFLQEAFRDYALFFYIIIPGIISQIAHFTPNKIKQLRNSSFIILLLGIALSFIMTGLIHKPPYASYIYPSVPILSLLATYFLVLLLRNLNSVGYIFCNTLLLILIGVNVVTWPHYKFIKTSISTITKTPHSYLRDIANTIKSQTSKEDEILSFYTPITIEAERKIPVNFNRDRFSISILSDTEAKEHHLLNSSLLLQYIRSRKAKFIVFTDRNVKIFGSTKEEQDEILSEIEAHYDLQIITDTIRYIENPNFQKLFIYRVKA